MTWSLMWPLTAVSLGTRQLSPVETKKGLVRVMDEVLVVGLDQYLQ